MWLKQPACHLYQSYSKIRKIISPIFYSVGPQRRFWNLLLQHELELYSFGHYSCFLYFTSWDLWTRSRTDELCPYQILNVWMFSVCDAAVPQPEPLRGRFPGPPRCWWGASSPRWQHSPDDKQQQVNPAAQRSGQEGEEQETLTTSYTGQSGVWASQKPLSEKFPMASETFWQEQGNSRLELLTMTMFPSQSWRPVQPQHSIYRRQRHKDAVKDLWFQQQEGPAEGLKIFFFLRCLQRCQWQEMGGLNPGSCDVSTSTHQAQNPSLQTALKLFP